MSRGRAFAGCLLVLLLAACWVGDAFYKPAESVKPIPAGNYRMIRFDEATGTEQPDGEYEHLRVSYDSDGLTRFVPVAKQSELMRVGFVPLEAGGRWYIAWFVSPEGESQAHDWVPYLLLDRRARDYRLYMPDCKDAQRTLALEAGAVQEADPKVALCRFPDRQHLEAAMRKLVGQVRAGIKLVPDRQ